MYLNMPTAKFLQSTPILSAVVPITRMSGKLENLESSINSSALFPIEIILVHDIQDNLTQAELESLVRKFPHVFIKLLVGEFGNPGDTRNLGIQEATGDWICFWDSDDLPFVKNYIEMINSASKQKAEVAVGLIRTINVSTGESTVHNFQEDTRTIPLEFGRIPGFTRFAFRNHIVKRVKFPSTILGEDQVFLARTNFLDKPIYFFQQIVYDYIIDFPGQASTNSANQAKLFASTQLIIEDAKMKSPNMTLFCYSAMVRTSLAMMKNIPRLRFRVFISMIKPILDNPGIALRSLLYHLRNRNAIQRTE
jgi:glycosyltransferase involved in cell wall biosynthesis